MNASGALVASNYAGATTLKYDATTAGSANSTNYGNPILKSAALVNRNGPVDNSTVVVSPGVYPAHATGNYKDVTASGVSAPNVLKQATLFPNNAAALTDNMGVRNYGERMLMVGGSNNNRADAGLFARAFIYARTNHALVRPVFIP
jgi:hypothetical protein